MRQKVTAILHFEARAVKDSGSPTILTKDIKCNANIERQFSQYYYRDNHRSMRNSQNLTVPKDLVSDIIDQGNRYILMSVTLNDNKYKVREILNHKSSFLKILDLEEMV